MTQAEVAVLLALANAHDPRQGIDDVRVQAWWDLLAQEAPDLPLDFAKETLNRHYARSTGTFMPTHLVAAWKNERERGRGIADLVPTGTGVPMPEWFRERWSR